MKKTALTLLIGMVIGLLAGSLSGAFAAVGDKVEAIFSEFNYEVDGVPVTIEANVLVNEGKSYLPTTQIANMLGFDVTYAADTRTIRFTTPKEPEESEVMGETEILEKLQKIDEDIVKQNENKVMWQGKIDKVFNELKSAGLTEQEIEQDTLMMQGINTYRDEIKNIEENIVNLEAQKAELEAQLQAAQ